MGAGRSTLMPQLPVVWMCLMVLKIGASDDVRVRWWDRCVECVLLSAEGVTTERVSEREEGNKRMTAPVAAAAAVRAGQLDATPPGAQV